MKIAIIVRKLNVRGGVQRHVLSLARELISAGEEVTLYTFLYDQDRCYTELLRGLDVVALGYYPRHVNMIINIFTDARAARALASLIDQDTKVLNPHDQVCYKVAYYFKARKRGVPAVWTMHDMPTRRFGYLRARELDPEFRRNAAVRGLSWLIDQYEIRRFIRPLEAIAVLDYRDQMWVRKYFGKDALVVRNGLDLGAFPYKERMSRPARRASLLMNGIFFRHRRFEDGIRALKTLLDQGYDAHLTITGSYKADPAYHGELVRLCSILSITDRVRFAGEVSEEELQRSYQSHDIFLFPNHLQSWGLAVFEAMASGLPVIISETAGASEVLKDGKTALIVPPKSPQAIAAAVKYLIDDEAAYKRLSSGGRIFVEQHISWKKQSREMSRIFAAVLANRRSLSPDSSDMV